MANIYISYWIYRDSVPIKRFIGEFKQNDAVAYAANQRTNYPGSSFKVSKQRLSEDVVWETEALQQYDKKETYDA